MQSIDQAVARATDTKRVLVGSDVLRRTAAVFRELFGERPAVIVADNNTLAVAGRSVIASFLRVDHATRRVALFPQKRIIAEDCHVRSLTESLKQHDAIPVAVGSGTINDITKLAAHNAGRPYLCVATAASMDGYTAFGASITSDGSKQTFSCPAPAGVVTDIDVIRAAPAELGASGYADLLAKVTAGADWIIADALGVEPIDGVAWDMVQKPLKASLANPEGVRLGSESAIRPLIEGLLLSGFGMQHHRTSRPASGAEHQFSHLWDMEHATTASHGFKVAVATVAVTKLYEALLAKPLEALDVETAGRAWPSLEQIQNEIAALYADPRIVAKAREEAGAKYVGVDELRVQLERLRRAWPELRERLREQLIPSGELVRMLKSVGAPTTPEEIGISSEQLKKDVRRAMHIRRRFTVLDVMFRVGD